MKREIKKKMSPSRRGSTDVSDKTLAAFLRRLATIYRDRATGNPALASALVDLADRLSEESLPKPDQATLSFRDVYSRNDALTPDFRNAGDDQIVSILDKRDVDRETLLRMGIERFAISRSRLIRLSKSEMADVIRSAFQHEKSLDIIANEAKREGKLRNS
ncbi:MAG: hypothetical protein AB7O80_09745 [Acetobacteraceae bacterium]